GVVLFFLELHQATGDKSFLEDARHGADYLLGVMDAEKGSGLYEGVAGICFALNETFKVTGDQKYQDGAKKSVMLIQVGATEVGKGLEWNEFTDIISGSAGIGLYLLYAAREWKDAEALALAERA